MLTIFTIPKPFEGHIGTIQRNAIRSWKRLSPECQVIICGDEPGSREVVSEFGIDQIPELERNEFGTPLLKSAFELAEDRSVHEVLCYANADLIFFDDLLKAVQHVSKARRRFLIVGESWNLDVDEEVRPELPDWEIDLRRRVAQDGIVRDENWIDYFVYPRSTVGPLPPFAVGRPAWDNWMIYQARRRRIPVVNVSGSAVVIHQNHAYTHVKQGTGDKWEGPEAETNRALVGDPRRHFSLNDASHRLSSTGLARIPARDLRRRIQTEVILTPAITPVYWLLVALHRPFWKLRKALAERSGRTS